MTYKLIPTNRPLVSRMTLSSQYGSRMSMTYILCQKKHAVDQQNGSQYIAHGQARLTAFFQKQSAD